MPILLTEIPEIAPAPMPPRKRWTREECTRLQASGTVDTERLELIDGELIDKVGKNRPHSIAIRRMLIWLLEAFGNTVVEQEVSIDISPGDNPSSEPEPDLIVLNKSGDDILDGNPQPQDLSLLVEISDTSLKFDLTVKALLYARAGILEYWVLDINKRQLFVHREPDSGHYLSVIIYHENEAIAPLAAPAAMFSPIQGLPPTRL